MGRYLKAHYATEKDVFDAELALEKHISLLSLVVKAGSLYIESWN